MGANSCIQGENSEAYLNYKSSSKHHDLSPSRINKDQCDVQAVYDTISSIFVNPFSEMDLVSLSTGVAPSELITQDLLNAQSVGEKSMKEFIDDPLKKLKLGTFSSMKKVVKVQTNGKTVQFSAQSNIFGKVAIVQQRRDIDLKKVFCYPLGPVPWALADATGGMMKTSKSTLMHHLEKGTTNVDEVPKPYGLVIDVMALVRQTQYIGLTFNEFADSLLNRALTLTSGASRIDIVFDVYRPHSIKNAERGHRSVGKVRLKFFFFFFFSI